MMKKISLTDFASEVQQSKNQYEKSFNQVMNSGQYILGEEVKSFEQQFAQYLSVKSCIGVANGLEALQIGLMALGVGRDDEVITTPLSAVASTLAILAVGARPIFVDTDENGLLNVDLIEAVITNKTKGILPVHLYGNSVNLKKLHQISKKNDIFILEDACQAHGSTYDSKKLGSFGDMGVFSFYPTKNIGAFGDGGAIVTNNSKLAALCYKIRDYGQSKKYTHTVYGLNSRLDELQAAFLQIKLNKLNTQNQKRQLIANRYMKNLVNVKEVSIVTPNENVVSNYHQFVIKSKKRSLLSAFLAKKGIPTAIHYPILIPDQAFIRKQYSEVSLPVSRRFVKEILSLPVHPYLDVEQVDYISKQITLFFSHE